MAFGIRLLCQIYLGSGWCPVPLSRLHAHQCGLIYHFLNLFHPRVLYPTNIHYHPPALRLSRAEFWEVATHGIVSYIKVSIRIQGRNNEER